MQTYKNGVCSTIFCYCFAFHYFLLLGSYETSIIGDGFKAGMYSSYLASLLFL